MATLKEFLERRMLDENLLRRVCVKEASIDEKEKRNFKIKTKLLDSAGDYHTDECVITIKSDEELSDLITKMNIIRLFRLIEEPYGHLNDTPYPHIVKAIDISSSLSEDKKSMDIVFHLINNIESL